jgi:lactoylglutathione lyase
MWRGIDCIQLYVDDLQKGIAYYGDKMGLKLKWKKQTKAGFELGKDVELVVQTQDKEQETDILADDVIREVENIKAAGGKILYGPFDIDIGKAAVIEDPWKNVYVILDTSKGTYATDAEGNVTGLKKV